MPASSHYFVQRSPIFSTKCFISFPFSKPLVCLLYTRPIFLISFIFFPWALFIFPLNVSSILLTLFFLRFSLLHSLVSCCLYFLLHKGFLLLTITAFSKVYFTLVEPGEFAQFCIQYRYLASFILSLHLVLSFYPKQLI